MQSSCDCLAGLRTVYFSGKQIILFQQFMKQFFLGDRYTQARVIIMAGINESKK